MIYSKLEKIGPYAFELTAIEKNFIPYRVKEISNGTFNFCQNLKEIEFPENSQLQKINEDAFSNTLIKSIKIPANFFKFRTRWFGSSIDSLEIKLHEDCKNFKYFEDKFILGKTNQKSNEFDSLVYVCKELENIVIPPFIKRIEPFSFTKFTFGKIIIPQHITQLSENTFYDCHKIKTIIIPPSLEKIKDEWFNNSNLRDVQLLGNNPNIKCYENKYIIGKSDPKSDVFDLLYFVNRDVTESITIPLFTKIIFSYAFASCKIKKIKIPSSVTEIHKNAFFFCENLEEVEIPQNSQIIVIGKRAFQNSNIK